MQYIKYVIYAFLTLSIVSDTVKVLNVRCMYKKDKINQCVCVWAGICILVKRIRCPHRDRNI